LLIITIKTTVLSAPVDVYYDWVDACEAVAKEHAAEGGDPDDVPAPRQSRTAMGSGSAGVRKSSGGTSAPAASGSGYTAAGEVDDFVVEDDPDAEGDFADDDF
jgi:hypothetical protein